MILQELNTAPSAQLTPMLLACCAAGLWADALIGGRPYASLVDLSSRAGVYVDALSDAEVERAVAAHPRIGARVSGNSTEAAWSRHEQGTLEDADRAELAELNRAYEARFDRVFLIHAQGRTAPEMITEILCRLGNTPDAERVEVREQLRRIVLARLIKALALDESGDPLDDRAAVICTGRDTA